MLGYFGVVLLGCEGWLGRQDQPKDVENPKESARQRNCSEIPASHPRLRPQLPLCACYPTACVSDDHARHDHADPGVISIALSFCVLARDHLLCILHPTTSGSLYAALQGNGGNLFGRTDVHSKSERRKRNAGATWRDSASFTFAQAWGKRSMCQIRVLPAYETSPRVPECGGLGRENSSSVALNEGLARRLRRGDFEFLLVCRALPRSLANSSCPRRTSPHVCLKLACGTIFEN